MGRWKTAIRNKKVRARYADELAYLEGRPHAVILSYDSEQAPCGCVGHRNLPTGIDCTTVVLRPWRSTRERTWAVCLECGRRWEQLADHSGSVFMWFDNGRGAFRVPGYAA